MHRSSDLSYSFRIVTRRLFRTFLYVVGSLVMYAALLLFGMIV